MSTFDKIKQAIEKKVNEVDSFDKKIKLDLDGQLIVIDGTTTPPSMQDENLEVDITITATAEVFADILSKKLNPQMALASGKIKLQGDMMAAVLLLKIL
jgi:putative sterol carrier protein